MSAEPTREQYADWRATVFGSPYEVWHDGPMFDTLVRVARSDVDGVVRMLRAGIRDGDPVAAQSMGVLAAEGLLSAGAEEPLREAAATATGTLLVRLAETLYAMTADPAWGGRIASVLTGDAFWSDKIDAAMALAHVPPTTGLVSALTAGVCDEEYLVRYHSATTLLRYAGRDGTVVDYPLYFDRIRTRRDGRPTADERADWRRVADELASLVPDPRN